jgi:hypothetical protein
LDLQDRKNELIDYWLEEEVPLLEYVTTVGEYHQVLLIVAHLEKEERKNWAQTTWNCGYDSKQTTTRVGKSKFKNLYLFVLECPTIAKNHTSIDNLSMVWPAKKVSNESGIAPIYDVRQILQCDDLEYQEVRQRGNNLSIGACAIFRTGPLSFSAPKRFVAEWVEYHRLIGIDHFWIYLTEPWNGLQNLTEQPHITFIPYNFHWGDHRKHSKRKTGIEIFWQMAMNHQCIFKAKRHNLQWVTTTDVDEYISVIATNNTVSNSSSSSSSSVSVPPLRALLDTFPPSMTPDLGSLMLKSIPFGRNALVEPENQTFTLQMDYVFRSPNAPWNRMKNIFRPQMAWTVSVHKLVADGKTIKLDPQTQASLYHFKLPHEGVFRGRGRRGALDPKMLVLDTALRDQYRDRVLSALNLTAEKL